MHLDDQMKICYRIAHEAHTGQTRRGGGDYVQHPLRVANRCLSEIGDNDLGRLLYCAAILHDVIEDTEYTKEQLFASGVDKNIVDMVAQLTKGPSEQYEAYLDRLFSNVNLRIIKVADIIDNLCDKPTVKQKEKYARALMRLAKKGVKHGEAW